MIFFMSLHGLKKHWEAPFFLRILDKIDPMKVIDGFEINGDVNDPYELNYMTTVCSLIKNYNRKIQFHSSISLNHYYNDLNMLNEQLKHYNNFSSILGHKVLIVIHPIDSYDTEISISRTHKFLENLKLLQKINDYNIVFSIENLNNSHQHQRLNTSELYTLIEKHPDINFCWDIGHEVSENTCTYHLNSITLNALNNVHIHDVNIKDHHPFIYNNTNYQLAITYLNCINYTQSVVVEINVDYLNGNTLLEKFRSYTQNIKLLKDYYQTFSVSTNTQEII